ncbi:hypothetical protein EPA93_37170 [Ktedonosporobacter rubrisoli]|uniref:Uncharacterized protein n=1 Tax=Ktedonosporobacter rubrisoli TaxID=2509675 RepID=A0A4P6JZP7_KTERU|nr:hypothetical protein [Ktedonosporobacter rubrisoli]QBD81307.1 hypothetical protein EPA93_37170 [Ktedonosporobacter rubrisoli]
MYRLDFATMKQVMAAHRKTGKLSTTAPGGIVNRREECQIEITLQQGRISWCALRGRSGWSLAGKEAEEALARLGTLRLGWTFTPGSTQLTPPTLPPVQREGIYTSLPRRTGLQVDPQQMLSWPNLHRHVFALADGTKSIAKISDMLSCPSDDVEQAARDLQSIGLIEMLRLDGKK